MHYQNMATIGIVALALAAGGCNRDVGESREQHPTHATGLHVAFCSYVRESHLSSFRPIQ